MTARAGRRLFIDIETVPTQKVAIVDYVQQNLKPPNNYKNEDAINKWLAEHAEEAFRRTSLDGAFGEIAVISYAVDDDPVLGTLPQC